ncbi:hypothetical protein Taro_018579 [Colocasia esculenta]|uniref:Uncharacterized protein n=1 Tax=Colocasia esculenta TaxID=4460 RepID=A0A843UJ08_COLES|nr:hypothetical protein [Colocasia esculenta]
MDCWSRVDQLREQMTLPEEVTCLARVVRDNGVILQRSTVQQPHVEDRRPSRLHAQESVISQRSTVQQPHVEDRRPSRLHAQEIVRDNGMLREYHENREKHFTIEFDGQNIHVEERMPSRLHAQERKSNSGM